MGSKKPKKKAPLRAYAQTRDPRTRMRVTSACNVVDVGPKVVMIQRMREPMESEAKDYTDLDAVLDIIRVEFTHAGVDIQSSVAHFSHGAAFRKKS